MRASVIVTSLVGLGLVAAGPAAAQCAWEASKLHTAKSHTVVVEDDALVAASTTEAPIVDIGQTSVVATPRRPAPREIIVTQGVATVAGIRPSPVEPPAIYVIEDPS